ncbi:MAG: S-layer family protein, partial [Verrucomicrobia bacterium]|nr:S-layer family protein [Verrucomicrobiota bacterium]
MTHTATALGNIDLSQSNAFQGTGVIRQTGAAAVLANTNSITLGTTNLTGDLTVNAVGAETNVTVNAVGVETNVTLGTGAGTAAQALSIGGNLSINLTNSGAGGAAAANLGNIGDNDYSPVSVFGNVNLVTSGGNVLLDAATKNGAIAPSVRTGAVSVSNPTGTAPGTVAIAETTTLNLGNVSATTLTASSVQGGIIDSGTLTVAGAATFAVTGNNSITLDSAANSFGTLNVAGNGQASVTSNSSVTIGTSTVLTGNLAVTTSAGKDIAVGAVAITGGLSLNSGGAVDFNNATATSVSGNLSATASAGAITQSGGGGLTVGGTASVSAGNATVAQNVTLGGANEFNAVVLNNSTGAVTINDVSNLTISGSAAGLVTAKAGGGTLANTWDLRLGNLTVGSLVAEAANGSAGNSGTIRQVGSSTSVRSFGLAKFTTNNANIVLDNAGNMTAKAGAGTLANTWDLRLGNLTVGSLVAEAANGSAGNSGTIRQVGSNTSVRSFGLASFTTNNANIVLDNVGNNFGRVELRVNNTDGARTVTLVEDGTIRLGTLSSRGTTTLTSRTGSILEDPDANVVVTNNGTLNLSAANGSVLIGGTTTRNGAFTTTGNVVTANISAPSGAAAVQSSGNLTLGNTNVNSLAATTSVNLFQSAALRVFGSASFKATGNITLTNTSNNFGRVSLETTTASRNITITEDGTLNLGTVTMPASATGSFTATSVSGDIIDTGLANLRIGGTV